MEPTVTDANTPASSTDDSMISSPDFVAPVGDPAVDKDGIDAAAAAAATDADDKKPVDDDKSKIEDDKSKDDRFDQHPRFVELNNTVKSERALRVAAEAKVAMFEKSPLNPSFIPAADGKVDFKDTTNMSAEELREWQEDDPKGFTDNLLKQAAHMAQQSIKSTSLRDETVQGIEKTFTEYAASNPDFNEKWESGEIEKYMNAHPGHNAISAHMSLTGAANTQALIDAAVAKATKETEERVAKNFQAKKNATLINPASPSRAAVDGVDAELKDTTNQGGFVSVAANRLAAMRGK